MMKRIGHIQFVLLLAAIFSLLPFVLAFGEAENKATLEEKVSQLQSDLMGLKALVKSLSLEMEKVSDVSTTDLGEFRPRLLTVEKMSSESAFEIQKLSGSISQLKADVDFLMELRKEAYQMSKSIKDLKYYIDDELKLSARIDANEVRMEQLQKTAENMVVVTTELERNFQPIMERVLVIDQHFEYIGGQAGLVETSLQQLAVTISQRQAAMESHIGELTQKVNQAEQAFQRLNQVTDFANEIQFQISEIATQSEEAEATNAEIFVFLSQFDQVNGELSGLQNELLNMSERLSQLSGQANANADLITRFSRELSSASDDEFSQTMSNRINELFAQFESSQRAVATLQQSLAVAQDEIKREVLQSLPRMPSTDEMIMLIQNAAAEKVRQAEERASQAQSMALIALLTGLSAVAVALLL